MSITKHTIVAISGKQGSGKTTLAKSLVSRYSGIHMKFATPLYEMHEAIRGVLEKYGFKNMAKKEGDFLQYLGTEFGRKKLGENIWAHLTRNAILDTIDKLDYWKDKAFIVVDDARFDNELDMFLEIREMRPDWNIITIRLNADEQTRRERADAWREAVNHPSEIGLDLRLDDFDILINTKTCSADGVFSEVCQAIEAT